MNAIAVRRTLSFLFSALFFVPLLASGAAVPVDVKVLFDTDNRAQTGCTVVTTGGLVKGVEQVLTTSLTYDAAASTAAVTGLTRQTCTDSVANTFSAPIAIDTTGWPVGLGGGFLTVETRMPMSAISPFSNMRLAFTASSGLLGD